MTVPQILRQFRQTGHRGFPVIDDDGNLIGVLTEAYMSHHLDTTTENNLTAGDIVEKNPFVVYPDQRLDRLLEAIEESEARIPVVSRPRTVAPGFTIRFDPDLGLSCREG